MSRPPSAPYFFIDRDLGRQFASALADDERFYVEPHDKHFRGEAPDDSVWLQFVATNGWIGVTHDKRLKRQHRAIIAAHKVRVIIVVGSRPLIEQAANFRSTYPRIERFVRNRPGPYTAKLYHANEDEQRRLKPQGRIELWGEWT